MAKWESVPLDRKTKKIKQLVNQEPLRPMATRLISLFLFLPLLDETKKSGRRLLGDVHFAEARKRASWITPVPGGR